MGEVLVNIINQDATRGEKTFVRILEEFDSEKPNYNLRLYYEPEGLNKVPDFGLYSDKHGIILFEIKDFSINNIQEFNFKSLKHDAYKTGVSILEFNRKPTFSYIDEFKVSCSKKNNIPVSMHWVFPNITNLDIKQKFGLDLKRLFYDDKKNENVCQFIFQDDFEDFELLDSKLTGLRKWRYIPDERSLSIALDRLNRYSGESPNIKKSKEGFLQTTLFDSDNKQNDDETLITLSRNQELLVKNLFKSGGYKFIKGPAGTGKTVLIFSKVQWLSKHFPNKKILVTYYTSSMDSLFKKLEEICGPNVTTSRIVKFCSKELKPFKRGEEFEQYSKDVLNLIKDSKHMYHQYFDFIFVDEGQDFSDEYAQIIDLMAKGDSYKEKNVIIAFDDEQNLMKKSSSGTLAAFSGKGQGRVKSLHDSYRTPIEIANRVQKLINEPINSVRSFKNAFHLKKLASKEQYSEILNDLITTALGKKELKICLSDIAIIYPSGLVKPEEVKLICNNLYFDWHIHTNQDNIDLSKDRIKVLSTNYCKGLDFKVIILIEFDKLDINKRDSKNMLYVALTRTLYYAIVLTPTLTPLLNTLKKESDNW